MTKTEVLDLLKENRDARGEANWKEMADRTPGMLSHVLSSCDATLPKSPIAFEIAKGWMASKDPVRRSCGYELVYELAKDKKDKRLTDEFFLGCVEKIGNTIAKEENWVTSAWAARS